MKETKKLHNEHRPLHLQIPGAFYFLTARTVDKKPFFSSPNGLQILSKTLAHSQQLYNAKIYGYILWPNHYHLLLQINNETLPQFVNNFHTFSARQLNASQKTKGRKIWHQYWDRFLRIQYTLDDLYRRVNYILHNPIKHGWCNTFDQAITYPWSSIPTWVEKYGKQGLFECWTKYPITDWSDDL